MWQHEEDFDNGLPEIQQHSGAFEGRLYRKGLECLPNALVMHRDAAAGGDLDINLEGYWYFS